MSTNMHFLISRMKVRQHHINGSIPASYLTFFIFNLKDPLMSECLIYQLKPGKTVVRDFVEFAMFCFYLAHGDSLNIPF